MSRHYRNQLSDGILEDFIEEFQFLSQQSRAGETSYKLLIEDEIDAICDVLDTFGELYQRKCNSEDIQPAGFWYEADREKRLRHLVILVESLHIFGVTGGIYLPTYTQPEKGYYQEMVVQIKEAIKSLPEAMLADEAKHDIDDFLCKARQNAHFLAATLPLGGSQRALIT